MIVGIDEVGRGPWAGPMVVGAVVLGCEIDGLTDSKKLSKKRREVLAAEIHDKAQAVGLGWVSAEEIDALGLAPALELACQRAVQEIDNVGVAYHEIIIDGTVNLLKHTAKGSYVSTMKKADLLIPSVSAASIVAKVARDTYMAEQDKIYPGYGFGSHVGYGTAVHSAAIDRLGVTPLHRLSFAPLHKYRQGNSTGSVVGSDTENLSPSVKTFSDGAPSNVIRLVTTRSIGNVSETVAAAELERRGHTILERNWKTKYCEIDIVSQLGDTIYFTEVKHRKNNRAGDGLAAITPKKLRQMNFAAKVYDASHHDTNQNLRLMAIGTSGEPPHVDACLEVE